MILQGEANECALACLCMILNSFGAHESLAELRARHSSGQPLSLEQLRHLAGTYRLGTRALRCDLVDLYPDTETEIPWLLILGAGGAIAAYFLLAPKKKKKKKKKKKGAK